MKKLLVIALGIAVVPSLVLADTADFQTAVANNNPYVFYRLGESSGTTATDSSSNGRNGTYVGSPTLGVSGMGAGSDTAVGFSTASSQYVNSSASIGFGSLLGASSYEFVFKTTDTSQRMTLFGSYNTGSAEGLEITLNSSAGGSLAANSIRVFLRNQAGNVALSSAVTAATISDGNFHHLAFTYDSSQALAADRFKGYLDGVQLGISSSSQPTGFADFAFDPTFAARNNRGTIDQRFNGTLDAAVLYSSALSGQNVLDHYNALTAVPEPSSFAFFALGGAAFFVRRRFSR